MGVCSQGTRLIDFQNRCKGIVIKILMLYYT